MNIGAQAVSVVLLPLTCRSSFEIVAARSGNWPFNTGCTYNACRVTRDNFPRWRDDFCSFGTGHAGGEVASGDYPVVGCVLSGPVLLPRKTRMAS